MVHQTAEQNPIEACAVEWQLFGINPNFIGDKIACLFMGIYQFRYMSFFFLFSAVPLAFHLDRLLPNRLSNFEVQKALLAAGIMGACALPLAYAQAKPELRLPLFRL